MTAERVIPSQVNDAEAAFAENAFNSNWPRIVLTGSALPLCPLRSDSLLPSGNAAAGRCEAETRMTVRSSSASGSRTYCDCVTIDTRRFSAAVGSVRFSNSVDPFPTARRRSGAMLR